MNEYSRINWDGWIREIRDIGKTNGLINFAANEFGQIDLDRSHPGGIAQFTSSGSVMLSNLVREPLAFAKALTVARRIKSNGSTHLSNYGFHSIYLVGGMASLEQDGFDLNLPLLLWPLELIRKTDDFELKLSGPPFVNPALVASLFHTYGIHLESAEIVVLLENAIDLLPISVIDYISSLLAPDARVEFRRGLIIGNFAVEPALMEADIRPEGNLLLRQLAEVAEVPEQKQETFFEPRLVADADFTQKRVVARAVGGDSFAVETLPGSGYTQTVVNVLAALVHENKRILVVTPRRQTLNELAERLSQLSLNGLMIRSSSTWLDIISAISRFEKAQAVDLVEAGVRRESSANNLESYLSGLRTRNEQIGHSLHEILEALARLSLMPNSPTSGARLSPAALEKFRDRSLAIEHLREAERLGLLRCGPLDSAWFGARFENQPQVEEIVSLTRQVSNDAIPPLDKKLDDLVVASNFRSARSFSEYGEFLTLWASVAASLDRFVPEVFDRDVTELIEATGPRKFGGGVSGATRRKLKKLAKDFLRAGMSVGDLNQALKDIKEQRDRWKELSNDSSNPILIGGFSDVNVAYRSAVSELNRIRAHLEPQSAESLFDLSYSEFISTLSSLALDVEPLERLSERNLVREKLVELGLEEVYRDFAKLHVTSEQLLAQFDLVWWQSAFELYLQLEPTQIAYTAEQITKLEQHFIDSDREYNELGVVALNHFQSQEWYQSLVNHPSEEANLKDLLRTRNANFRSVHNVSNPLSKILLGVVGTSPYGVAAELPNGVQFDTVLVLDAAGSTVGENMSAILRSRQIIAFGDSAIAAPIGFELEPSYIPTKLEPESVSIFEQVSRVFGVESMRKSWRPSGQTLGSLINSEFYQNRIIFEPTANDYAGRNNFEIVPVRAQPVGSSDLVAESPDAEVAEAVRLVQQHALKHPESSLLLVTASAIHCERIIGQLDAKVLEHAELKQFFDSHGDEKFEITTLNRLSHRVADRVIFSPGFGILTDGFAANELGQLSESGGRRTLANLLVSARESLTLVTSISADTLPKAPVGAAKQFAKMFRFAGVRAESQDVVDFDPMLADLALRLRKLGAHVTLGFTNRIPMAVSYGAKSAVIIPDWNLVGDDLSEKVRLRPALLEAMGWMPIQVHALEIFADPQSLALRIGEILGMEVLAKAQTLFDEPSFEETAAGWGEANSDNDQRLRNDKPPHWG